MHGNHVEDQRAKHHLLAAWKYEASLCELGARYLCSLSEDERNTFVLVDVTLLLQGHGGEHAWNTLKSDEQSRRITERMMKFADSFAGEVERLLTEAE